MSADRSEGSIWITGDVAIPQELLDAHAQQKLVIFVGAGASVDAPSSLPLFDKLARDLADLARFPFASGVALDFFLGSMPPDFAVHTHARDLIARDDSTPNSTHRAIVRLAEAGGPIRIVTTNFDDHLMTAARDEGILVGDRWTGPAVPLGGDFAGIVHLHGSVLRDPRELILTDADFGRAYVTHAWATRFLLAMFGEYTVLFVGYSHDDPIMRYLALGLPSATPRFVLTDAASVEDPKWARLGLTTIEYPVANHNHGALVAALDSWNVRARMGQFEHQARMHELVEAGPKLTPVDRDYVTARVKTPDGAREFATASLNVDPALRLGWLAWAESLPEFKALFTGGESNEASAILAHWFCQGFLAQAELSGTALQTVQRLGQRFDLRLFDSARWSVGALAGADEVAGRRWQVFLATSIHGHSAPVDSAGILPYEPTGRAEHMSTLRAVLQPYLLLKRRWFLDEEERPTAVPDAEVAWTGEQSTITAHLMKTVEVAGAGDIRLRSLLESALNAAYDLLDAYHGDRAWDPLSHGRSAIEPHSQDDFHDPIDSLIDGLRAFGEKALLSSPQLVDEWWSQGRGVFQRLALHLLAGDAGRSFDDKLTWLLDRSLLYETDFKHEVYQVLKNAGPGASDEVKQRLLTDVLIGPDLPGQVPDVDRHTAYMTYNLMVWLATVDPQWAEAASALDAIQTANPNFAPREHPDFDMWMSSGTWGGKLPMEPEEFVRAWDEDPDLSIDDLLSRDYSERTFGEPDWDDALSLIKQIVESRPDIGQKLWDLLDQKAVETDLVDDIRRAIIEGWSAADLGELTEIAIARTAQQVSVPKASNTIARFLRQQISKLIESDESRAMDLLRRLANDLWQDQFDAFITDEDSDPLSFAPLYLNSWPGDVAQYWLSEIDRRWRKNRESWTGLNQQERDALIGMLTDSPSALNATGPALARQLFFVFAADAQFAVEYLFPLFRDEGTSALAWNPYLHHPRINDKLLASGFTEIVIAEWSRLEQLGQDDLLRQFFGLVAWIVSFADITDEQRSALLDASVLSDDGAHAADFASEVARLLRKDSVDGEEVFKRWLGDHLTARIEGIPRTALPEEMAQWADAVPYVGEQIPKMIELFSGRGVGLGERYFPAAIAEKVMRDFGPGLVTHFAERISNTTSSEYLMAHRIRKLVENFRGALGDAATQPLVDAAVAHGFLTDGDT